MHSLEKEVVFVPRDVHFYGDVFSFINNEACQVEEVPTNGGAHYSGR